MPRVPERHVEGLASGHRQYERDAKGDFACHSVAETFGPRAGRQLCPLRREGEEGREN